MKRARTGQVVAAMEEVPAVVTLKPGLVLFAVEPTVAAMAAWFGAKPRFFSRTGDLSMKRLLNGPAPAGAAPGQGPESGERP